MSYRKKIEHWEGFADTDPLWSILTDPQKRQGKWDVDDFFHTGEIEIDFIFKFLENESWLPKNFNEALDFGCGVGRLTRAISRRFKITLGIDASVGMVKMAESYHADIPGIEFKVNTTSDVQFIRDNTMSFIYCAIVLQHIPVEASYNFIREFCRILEPGGVLVFQIPTADIRQLSFFERLRVWLKPRERLANLGLWKKYHMDMNVYDENQIEDIIQLFHCRTLGRRITNHTDKAFNGEIKFMNEEDATGFISTLFVVRK